jgi:hypothetical protein
VALASVAVAQEARPQHIADSLGNNFTVQNGSHQGYSVRGKGTQRYIDTHNNSIRNESSFEVCVYGVQSFNAWVGSTQSFHHDNTPVTDHTRQRCIEWTNVTTEHLQNNNLNVNIWFSNTGREHKHSNKSESDFFTQITYHNISFQSRKQGTDNLFRALVHTIRRTVAQEPGVQNRRREQVFKRIGWVP